jgi:hypothetical protein
LFFTILGGQVILQFHESNEEKLLREAIKCFEPEALVCEIQNKMADSGYYWIELYKKDEIRIIIVFGDNRNWELTMSWF